MTARKRIVCLGGLAVGLATWIAAPSANVAAPTLEIRLMSPVSTSRSKPGDPIQAVSVTRLVVDGRVLATPGCKMPGVVVESIRPKSVNAREVVSLEFASLVDRDNVSHPFETKLIDVDNARETVDDEGRIRGVAPVEKSPDAPAEMLRIAANGTQILRALMSKAIGKIPPQIDYKPGVELVLRVTGVPKASSIVCGPVAAELRPSDELSLMVNAQPIRTRGRTSDVSSDVTNIVFVGSRDALFAGFAAAGWLTAEALNATSGAKTFLATLAGEGYAEAPVSQQFLDGRPPDAVFQKQLNTFAKRHHVRIWQRDDAFGGQPVWIAAATHDTAFVLSKEVKLFTHGIDPDIDAERLKIVNDLAFAGAVEAHTLVPRPRAPLEATTSIGEKVRTDGKAAVIVLRKPG